METKPTQSGSLTAEQLIGAAALPVGEPVPPNVCPMQRTVCAAWDGLTGECLAASCLYAQGAA